MTNDSTQHPVLFPGLFNKPLVVQFDQPHGSSDGGAVLLKACDERLRLTERIAACFRDERQEAKVVHTLHDLIRQRVYGLACGYEDANDAGRLASDPMHKLLIDRDPFDGDDLASQSTLSRFENSLRPAQLFRAGMAIAETLLADFGGQRWYSVGRAMRFDNSRFERVDELKGLPVYRDRAVDTGRVYVTIMPDGLVAPFARR